MTVLRPIVVTSDRGMRWVAMTEHDFRALVRVIGDLASNGALEDLATARVAAEVLEDADEALRLSGVAP